MTPHKQRFRHKPEEGVWGDCHRTAYACLLNLDPEEVPHVFDRAASGDEAEAALRQWLAGRGLIQWSLPFQAELDAVLSTMGKLNPGVFFILGGRSRNGTNHSVICCGGKIIHDPSLDDAGIVGPCDDGFYWISLLSPAFLSEDPAAMVGEGPE